MGFGGMGKTSLALKLLNDVAVEAKYGAYRYFIPCDIVCSAEPTVEALLQTMSKLMKLQLTDDAVTQLHTIFKPTILVLDNFETLWENSKDQYDVQRLLEQLDSVPQIMLIITMRGQVPPTDINWLELPHNGLLPLAESVSLNVFNAISGYNVDMEKVSELVGQLAGWPLAIMLIAHQAKTISPKVLVESWKKEKTLLLAKPRTQPH
ncbi:uncharacterized protein BT62DRAFT_938179 [Guyanagaster necrorhizus]|uniref:NACHT domain-containing protein n=1 Tax=Guyanagaster necrorhizus TaxID=856835 RepID=A0A9P7VGP4_9AGAR|nr:uncharacterized protein BT62DRAFT_938179 [Guyanagaster necrorhizus MCA 3950]KAG7440215.1 hypothetical protein BT62DRAFT_938179 [Guyanagaster necrorhizus MCA 3950]